MRGLRKHSLSRLLFAHEAAFLFLVAVTGLLSGLSAHFWQKTSVESIRISNSIYLSEQIRSALYRQLQEVTRASLMRETDAMAVYYEHSRRIGSHFNQLRRSSLTRQEDEAVQALQQSYRQIQRDIHKLFEGSRKAEEALQLEILDLRNAEAMFNEFEQDYLKLKALYEGKRRALERAIALGTRYAPILIPVLFIAALVIVFYTSRIFRNGVTRPVAAIMAGATALSRGKLSHKIPEQGVREVAELAGSINRMAGDLKVSRAALVEHERQAALGSLIPVVAHNIRNPLASIRAAAQVLEDGSNPNELREGRKAIVTTIDRLGRWVNALVSYLHPLKPELRRKSVAGLVDAVLALLQGKMDEKRLRLRRENWDPALELEVDPDLMEQAVYALLANAVDAAPPGSELALALERSEQGLALAIRDHGPGLPFQPEPGNLEPGPSTKRFGTGLGIPIAFKICQSHGWTLSFEAPADGGARVVMVAPWPPAAAIPAVDPPPEQAP